MLKVFTLYMNHQQLHRWQEKVFDFSVYTSYFLIVISSLGFSATAPKYLETIDYYVRIYICLFLMWRFNPLKQTYEFTDLDRKIAFSAGVFILTTTVLNTYLINIKEIIKKYVKQ